MQREKSFLGEGFAKNIVVTGASGGLGRELVRSYAAEGVAFLLFGRDPERLARVGEDARASGATVTDVACDARDREAIRSAIEDFCLTHEVDLVLHLVGTKCGNEAGIEPDRAFDDVLSTNLAFPVFVNSRLLPRMRARGKGRVVLVSSLAAVAPHPDLISYSASKAGLSAYGAALRRALQGTGVGVSIVEAGFIDTPMTDIHEGPTPMKLSSAKAARHIREGIDRGRAYIRFPYSLWLASKLLSLLPTPLGDRVIHRLRARILDEAARVHAANSAVTASKSRSS